MAKEKHTIHVNNKPYQTESDELTGAQIKALAAPGGVKPDYELFLVHEPGSGPPVDEAIGDSQVVKIRNGMKFRAIPAGNRGMDA
ncbi:MAG: multiubiquitin domain-containing protein [Candidatus Thermoplasmatota archaeon]|jgi:hypothetical protein